MPPLWLFQKDRIPVYLLTTFKASFCCNLQKGESQQYKEVLDLSESGLFIHSSGDLARKCITELEKAVGAKVALSVSLSGNIHGSFPSRWSSHGPPPPPLCLGAVFPPNPAPQTAPGHLPSEPLAAPTLLLTLPSPPAFSPICIPCRPESHFWCW